MKQDLHRMQHAKCCYCEQIQVPLHNDVEHYRPWSKYWWLAWTWENLLFACRACNQKGGKEDAFPLAPGSLPLAFGEPAPGDEFPELIDPSIDDPREHIRFVRDPRGRWGPIGISWRGVITIRVVGIDRDEFRVSTTATSRRPSSRSSTTFTRRSETVRTQTSRRAGAASVTSCSIRRGRFAR